MCLWPEGPASPGSSVSPHYVDTPVCSPCPYAISIRPLGFVCTLHGSLSPSVFLRRTHGGAHCLGKIAWYPLTSLFSQFISPTFLCGCPFRVRPFVTTFANQRLPVSFLWNMLRLNESINVCRPNQSQQCIKYFMTLLHCFILCILTNKESRPYCKNHQWLMASISGRGMTNKKWKVMCWNAKSFFPIFVLKGSGSQQS